MVFVLVYIALPVVVALGLLRTYKEHTWGCFKSNISLSGKVFLITGSNSGVGKETARELARRDACVIMACRDMNNVKIAIDDIRKTTSSGVLVPMQLDLASLQSVRKFSEQALEKFPKIDVLINNAGVYYPLTASQKTKDGFEMNFGVNHLGHFLLTKLLMERIKESAPSRIVIVSSGLHERGLLDVNDLNIEKRRESLKNSRINHGYCASKLANVYHCRELAERLKGTGVDVVAVCPGFTYTRLSRYSNIKWWQYLVLLPVALLYLRSPWQGAQTILYCACDESVKGNSGKFYKNCQACELQHNFDPEIQSQLWEKSELLISNAEKNE